MMNRRVAIVIRSDQAKLIGTLGAILLAGFLITSGWGYFASRHAIRQGVSLQTLSLTGDNIYSEIQKDLLQPVLIASLMSNDAFLRDWTLHGEKDVAQMTRYLSEIRAKYGTVTSYLISDRTRNYYHATGLNRHIDENDPREAWYFRAKSLREPYEINVDIDQVNHNTITIFINHRVFDYENNFIGITGVGLTFDTVAQLIESYQGRFRRRIYFVSPSGTIMVAGKVMDDLRNRSIRDKPGLGEIADQLMHSGTQSAYLEYRSENGPVLVNSRFIKELGWYLIVEQDELDDMQPVRRAFAASFLISGGVTLAVLIIVVLTVNTYRRRIEHVAAENLQLARAKQDFLAMFSHEIRNLLASLNAVIGSLIWAPGHISESVDRKHRKLEAVSHRITLLVSNFLADSRLEVVDFRPHFAPTDLRALIGGVIDEFAGSTHQVEFSAREGSTAVKGDQALLRLAISNLIDNAIKYSPGSSRVVVSLEVRDGNAYVSITDEGVGIAPEELKRIFEPFHRDQRTIRTQGTGLGLSIVERIARLHHGEIQVRSILGSGSTFTLILSME